MIRKQYLWCTLLLCLSYLITQIFLIPHTMFVADEFWFAHHIYQYTQSLPYRDFLPYKSTLGYYLLTLPMYLSHDVIKPLFYIKDEIAIINTLALALCMVCLKKYFRTEAILVTLTLIIFSQLFLIYSTDLRVDMLTAWVAFFSVLLAMSGRYRTSGIMMAVAFLISQKTLWYLIAMNGALGVTGFITARNWQTLRNIIWFNLAAFLTLCGYIAFWSHFSSFQTVFYSLFTEAVIQARITWFAYLYTGAWLNILGNGPLLYLLWPLTGLRFVITPTEDVPLPQRIFTFVFASIVLLFMITYQQPFPYNTVLAVPAFMLLFADFFTWLLNLKESGFKRQISDRSLFWFLSLYSIAIVGLVLSLGLMYAYLLIALIPAIFYRNLLSGNFSNHALNNLLILSILFTGVVYPLVRIARTVYLTDGSYQMQTIQLANSLIEPNESYVAGVQTIYNRDQAVPGLKNLIGPAIEYLYTQDPNTAVILIGSLDMTPTTVNNILNDLKNKPIKLFINTHRIAMLPAPIRNYLFSNYEHFWSSIYLYSPKISTNQTNFTLKFNGLYRVKVPNQTSVMIDKKTMKNNNLIYLNQGQHSSTANTYYRLQYIPATPFKVLTHDLDDHYYEMLRAIVI